MTLLWFALLRFATKIFWLSPVLPWAACIATLIVSYLALRKLALPSEDPAADIAQGKTTASNS